MVIAHRCHILHVTESDTNSGLFSDIVKKTPSLLLERVTTSAEAINLVARRDRSSRPNLLLLDRELADGRAGPELLTALKSDRTLRAVPVLVFASAVPRTEVQRIYSMGASCVIMRELSPDAFTRAVELICTFWGNIASLPYCDPGKPGIV
jgi:DNA-binding NarL/FixJ family response regulator